MASPRNSQRFWIPVLVIAAVLLGVGFAFALFSSPSTDDIDSNTDYLTSSAGDDSSNESPEETDDSAATDNSSDAENLSDYPTGTGSETADGYDDFGACDEEGQKYCSGFYGDDWESWAAENGYTTASWKLGLVDCIGAHEAENSDECNASIDRRAELNEEMNTICSIDRAQYCPGVVPKPGSEPQVDCLKEHYDQLTVECAEALDAHENAKPENQQDFSYRE